MSKREQRCFPRRPVAPVAVHLQQDDGKNLAGQVLDYSPSGLSVRVQEEVPLDALLKVLASRGARFEVRVRHCRAQGATWRLGCEFVEKQHWDKLRLFGS